MPTPPNQGLMLAIFLIGLTWLIVSSLALKRIEKKHPNLFMALGKPRLSRYGVNYAFLDFILSRDHRELHDRYLSILCDGLLIILTVELIGAGYVAYIS